MATLSGNKIKDTYQSLIKLTDNGNLTTGAKQLTDGFGNNSPLYISTTQIGIGVTPEATYDLHVYSNAKVGGNLTVTGDLTVEGTTTTIDTQTLTVEDPLIEVASNNTSTDAVDIGWYGKYAPSGTVLYAGLFRDTGDSKFKLFKSLEEQPTTTVNTSGTGYTRADLVIGNLEATQINLGDNEKIRLGTGNDLEIFHDGNNSYVQDFGTGDFYVRSNSTLFLKSATTTVQAYGSTETIANFIENGAVELYYDNSKKLETTTSGVTVTGTIISDGLDLGDSEKIRLGDSQDLEIYHNGSHSYIDNNTGDIIIRNDAVDKGISFLADDGAGGSENYVYIDGGAFQTKFYKDTKHLDSVKAFFGTGSDLQIWSTGSTDYISSNNNSLIINSFADNKSVQINTTKAGGSLALIIKAEGSTGEALLYHLGVEKLKTSTTGVTVTGRISGLTDPSASQDAATKAYVDAQLGGQDTLAEILANGNTTGGTDIAVSAGDDITFTSTSKAIFNSALEIYHDATNNVINGTSGNFYVSSAASLFFRTNLNQTALTLDTSQNGTLTGNLTVSGTGQSSFAGQVTVPATPSASTDAASKGYVDSQIGANNELSEVLANGNTTGGTDISVSTGDDITFADGSSAYFGTGNDLRLYHSGSSAIMYNGVGNMTFTNYADDSDIIFQSDDGSGGVTQYFRIDGGANLNVFSKDIFLADNIKALFGSNSDLQIYHDGTNSIVTNTNGDLRFIQNADDKDIVFYCDQSGSAVPYFQLDGSLELNKFVKNVRLDDNIELQLGTNGDLRLEHTGTNGTITNYTGNLTIEQQADNSDIIFKSDDGAGGVAEYFRLDGSTATFGTYRYTIFPDYSVLAFGSQAYGDLRIFHDGTHSYIYDAGTGRLNVRTSQFRVVNAANSEIIIDATENGSVDLYYDNSKKFETTSTGVKTTGEIVVDGTTGAFANSGITLKRTGILTGDADILLAGTSGSEALAFRINDSEKVRINNSGQVQLNTYGSGSFTGTATYRLAVDSSGEVIEIPIGDGAVDGSGAAGQVAVWSDTDTITGYTRFKVYDSGGQIQVTDGTRDIRINSGYGGSTAMIGTVGSHDLGFMTANSQRVTIDSSGSVGIGTTSPDEKLVVYGSVNNDDIAIKIKNTYDDNTVGSAPASALILESASNNGYIRLTGSPADVASEHILDIGSTATGNEITFTTQGTERLRVDASGNVGIGQSNPTSLLHLYKFQADTPIRLQGSAGSYYITNDYSDDALTFIHNSTERMRIDSSGNLLVSKTSANNGTVGNQFMTDGSANSTVNGDTVARFNRLTSDGEIIRLQKDTSTVGSIGSTTSYLNSSLGIGTTSPASKLHLFNAGYPQMSLESNGGTWQVGVSSGNDFAFRKGTSGSDYPLWLDSSGNVGIGTTSPTTAKLVVDADQNTYGLRIDGDTTTGQSYGVRLRAGTNSVDAALRVENTSASTMFLVRGDGNVGIGTSSPSYKLDVEHNGNATNGIQVTNTNSGTSSRATVVLVSEDAQLNIYATSSSYNGVASWADAAVLSTSGATSNGLIFNAQSGGIKFQTATTERMRITSSGNVGIGTSSPDYKLDLRSGELAVRSGSSGNGGLAKLGNSSSSAILQLYDSSGNEDVRISTSLSSYFNGGNVGIGTTSPVKTLHISASNPLIRLSDSDAASTSAINSWIEWYRGDNTERAGYIGYPSTSNSDFYVKNEISDGDVVLLAGNTEKMRIDSSGNVGIGVTPSNADSFVKALQVGNAALTSEDYNLNLMANAYDTGSGYNRITAGTAGRLEYATDGSIKFYNASNSTAGSSITWNETMKISIDGDVLFNCTSLPTGATGGAGFETSGTLMRLRQSSPTTSTTKLQIYYNANGEVGSIHTSGTATAFNTSSDYRLKDDYKDFNGLELVDNINVYDFEWKSDKTRSYGVKAHELQEVIPQAVNGEKDGKDMQQVDYSKLVPILLKSIQELKQEIEILKSK